MLVGTTSIEKSERLRDLLKRKGIKHVVLNAKYHEREAEIVAQAGRYGMVTIATNMAGRGTDILLGGNPEFMAKQEVAEARHCHCRKDRSRRHRGASATIPPQPTGITTGSEFSMPDRAVGGAAEQVQGRPITSTTQVIGAGGLFILGTERHESRRIDNQLRGRAGRQGDPGASRFYLSLEDDLMRIFAKEWVSNSAAAAWHGRRRSDRVGADHAPHRSRAEGSGGRRTSRPANICSNTTT